MYLQTQCLSRIDRFLPTDFIFEMMAEIISQLAFAKHFHILLIRKSFHFRCTKKCLVFGKQTLAKLN